MQCFDPGRRIIPSYSLQRCNGKWDWIEITKMFDFQNLKAVFHCHGFTWKHSQFMMIKYHAATWSVNFLRPHGLRKVAQSAGLEANSSTWNRWNRWTLERYEESWVHQHAMHCDCLWVQAVKMVAVDVCGIPVTCFKILHFSRLFAWTFSMEKGRIWSRNFLGAWWSEKFSNLFVGKHVFLF